MKIGKNNEKKTDFSDVFAGHNPLYDFVVIFLQIYYNV